MNEKQVTQLEKNWEEEKDLIIRSNKVKEEKKKLKSKKVSTTKLLVVFLFVNCTLIELFTGYVTIKSFDLALINGGSPELTPLVTLIGAVVSEVIGFAVYSLKSMKENTVGGIVYDSAMSEFNSQGGSL